MGIATSFQTVRIQVITKATLKSSYYYIKETHTHTHTHKHRPSSKNGKPANELLQKPQALHHVANPQSCLIQFNYSDHNYAKPTSSCWHKILKPKKDKQINK